MKIIKKIAALLLVFAMMLPVLTFNSFAAALPKKVEIVQNTDSEFFGKTIVITGSFENFTRDELSEKYVKMRAFFKTNLLILQS